MRDNYVGDVGDYFKYGLLRHLTGETAEDREARLSLGVVWYLYPDPCRTGDGLHLQYTRTPLRERYRPADPPLYDTLCRIIAEDVRSVAEVERRHILSLDARFFVEPLSFAGLPKGNVQAISKRIALRKTWLQRSLDATRGCDLIFVDPDNGLEVSSVAAHQDKGPKFAFYDEMQAFWERGQSLIIYQHMTRQGGAVEQIDRRVGALRDHLTGSAFIDAVYFPSFGGRIFFVASQERHRTLLTNRLAGFRKRWKNHTRTFA